MLAGFRHMRASSEVKAVLARSALAQRLGQRVAGVASVAGASLWSAGIRSAAGVFRSGGFDRRGADAYLAQAVALGHAGVGGDRDLRLDYVRRQRVAEFRRTCLATHCCWQARPGSRCLASLNVSAQTMCPGHMRARAISMYLLVLQGGLASAARPYGEPVAERVGLRPVPVVCRAAACWLGVRGGNAVQAALPPNCNRRTAGMD